MGKAMIVCGVLAAMTTGATAQTQKRPTQASDVPNNDPNQVVCVVENEIGSRLTRKRVCRTRAEWAEHARQTRDRVDRAQQQRQDFNN